MGRWAGLARSEVSTGFEDFYRARAPQLFRYASVVAGRDGAEDACQEAWLRMWRSWGTADAGRLDAWARQVVRNCCFDGQRHRWRAVPGADVSALVSPDAEPEEVAVSKADAAAIGDAVRRLPAHQREVLWMREIIGLTYAEIGDALGIPLGTVMSRLHAARRKLARNLVG